ncbi:putative wall-associated receptor kinase-like 16 [Olea europaea var. sylvestris]|uniref:putative wall-associated receptor kinase-like 16 n=1 Tax=Olea europaea var. sylvestris TaxID=158386 RepID=UPI000C1CE2E6|nr:putative wall-associated receptor kinase-like 16 [Olea europaea var. sylvestris]
MGLHMHLLRAHFFLVILLIFATKSVSIQTNFPIAKPNCTDRCGDVSIPFPFGTREGCYLSKTFLVTCNHTHYDPPKPFLRHSNIEITNISLDGQLTVLQFIAKECYNRNGTEALSIDPYIRFKEFTVNNTANKFTVVGCDTYAFVSGSRNNKSDYETGCTSQCASKDDLEDGSCSGVGCCHSSIPKGVWKVKLTLKSYSNFTESYDNDTTTVWDVDNCSYAFLAEESAFTFSPNSLSILRNVEELPMVVDWAIDRGTCEESQKNTSSYACKSTNSSCKGTDNGYRCYCSEGYEGNPYLIDGCKGIKQAPTFPTARKWCHQTILLCQRSIAFGISLGITVFILVVCWLYSMLNRRKLNTMKQKFFLQNGGLLLQEKLTQRQQSPVMAKIFTSAELKKATDNFHDSRIVGQGGYGTVYKGLLTDNRLVAIKKSKEVDPHQVEQFINEVIVLSQINHRNVVKLLGCCLETQVPLLVYEYIENGTLFEHIHSKTKARSLSWDMRLRVAAEAAGVLAYLHSAASPPIIHRDIKSTNILLDISFTAKVSDFGASRLVPLDQTQLSTIVQGTLGYLDPEYIQTNQLTQKSDVYSFGVVLVELLTGKKALSYDRPVEERSLANYFLLALERSCLFQVLDDNIICGGNSDELTSVAMLAKICLHVKGEDRPSMKEVAKELEGLRLAGKHSWNQTEPNEAESESLLSGKMNAFAIANGDGSSSTAIGYDNSRDHIILPMGGGR